MGGGGVVSTSSASTSLRPALALSLLRHIAAKLIATSLVVVVVGRAAFQLVPEEEVGEPLTASLMSIHFSQSPIQWEPEAAATLQVAPLHLQLPEVRSCALQAVAPERFQAGAAEQAASGVED